MSQECINLIIGGALKCGTTSLFNYLADHPEICPSNVKETYFFQSPQRRPLNKYNVADGMDKYELLFKGSGGSATARVRLEATPQYLCYPESPELIRANLGNPHIVFILRNPIDRLVSCFGYEKQHHFLPADITFDDYVRYQLADQAFGGLDPAKVQSLKQSKYSTYLKNYVNAFGRDRVHVYLFEEFRNNPRCVAEDICGVVGIDPGFYDDYRFKVYNQTMMPMLMPFRKLRNKMQRTLLKNLSAESWLVKFFQNMQAVSRRIRNGRGGRVFEKPQISDDTLAALASYFADEGKLLTAMLGWADFDWDLTAEKCSGSPA